MAHALADFKHEWQQFREDSPGERFCNHRERMKKKSRKHAAVTLSLGVLLLAGGVVLLFIPGPGIPLMVFGLALIATHSKRLSDVLDRTEPRLRDVGKRTLRWWKQSSRAMKAALIVGGIVVASAVLMAMWRWVVSAYLL